MPVLLPKLLTKAIEGTLGPGMVGDWSVGMSLVRQVFLEGPHWLSHDGSQTDVEREQKVFHILTGYREEDKTMQCK